MRECEGVRGLYALFDFLFCRASFTGPIFDPIEPFVCDYAHVSRTVAVATFAM